MQVAWAQRGTYGNSKGTLRWFFALLARKTQVAYPYASNEER